MVPVPPRSLPITICWLSGINILDYIHDFELEHSVTFKSLKSIKDKDGALTGITIDFDGDDISVIESPVRVKKYHLREQEQKIPDGFQIYDERLEVAGIQHRRDAAAQFVSQTNQWLEFESEPLNNYDPNAIKILGCYQQNNENIKLHVGYVPASIAKQITNFSADECKARLLKTYIGESGYVEILFQVLGPKGRIEEYAAFYEPTSDSSVCFISFVYAGSKLSSITIVMPFKSPKSSFLHRIDLKT